MPFADWDQASVWVIQEVDIEGFTIVVAPLSIYGLPKDNYPKYLIRFDKVLTLLRYDEACAFDRGYSSLAGFGRGMAYEWLDSPWMIPFRGCHEFGTRKLHHYLILGDDGLVEVISVGEARVERIDTKRFIEMKHEV